MGKGCIDAEHYEAICLMFDSIITHCFLDDANSRIKKVNRGSGVIACFD